MGVTATDVVPSGGGVSHAARHELESASTGESARERRMSAHCAESARGCNLRWTSVSSLRQRLLSALLTSMGQQREVVLLALLLALGAASCDEEAPAKAPLTAPAGWSQAPLHPTSPGPGGPGAIPPGTDLPWPLPLPSSSMEIPKELRVVPAPGDRLTVAADRLVRALRAAGYADLRFYDIPKGFALVTPLELIDDQGLAVAHPDPKQRFSAAYPGEGFFTMRFWSDLLRAKTGRFRVFVFVVIDHPFGYAKDVTDAEILWKHPTPELPLSRADLAYTAEDQWYALVYEVVHASGTDLVTMAEHPSDPALHLAKSGVQAALQRLAGERPSVAPTPGP